VELINWIWFAGAIASAATLGIADGKARNIQPIEALWLALLWVTETLLAAMQFGRNWHIAAQSQCGSKSAAGESSKLARVILILCQRARWIVKHYFGEIGRDSHE
jgi:hypothetical protein